MDDSTLKMAQGYVLLKKESTRDSKIEIEDFEKRKTPSANPTVIETYE